MGVPSPHAPTCHNTKAPDVCPMLPCYKKDTNCGEANRQSCCRKALRFISAAFHTTILPHFRRSFQLNFIKRSFVLSSD